MREEGLECSHGVSLSHRQQEHGTSGIRHTSFTTHKQSDRIGVLVAECTRHTPLQLYMQAKFDAILHLDDLKNAEDVLLPLDVLTRHIFSPGDSMAWQLMLQAHTHQRNRCTAVMHTQLSESVIRKESNVFTPKKYKPKTIKIEDEIEIE